MYYQHRHYTQESIRVFVITSTTRLLVAGFKDNCLQSDDNTSTPFVRMRRKELSTDHGHSRIGISLGKALTCCTEDVIEFRFRNSLTISLSCRKKRLNTFLLCPCRSALAEFSNLLFKSQRLIASTTVSLISFHRSANRRKFSCTLFTTECCKECHCSDRADVSQPSSTIERCPKISEVGLDKRELLVHANSQTASLLH